MDAKTSTDIALSTAEAAYVAACEACMKVMAEYNILQEILPPQCRIKLSIGIDNRAAYVVATNTTYSRRTRHIELRWHHVTEQFKQGVIDLHKVIGEENPADMSTKSLEKNRFHKLKCLSGVGNHA